MHPKLQHTSRVVAKAHNGVDIDRYISAKCNCTETRWQLHSAQYTFAHKQYTEQHNETKYKEQIIHNNT